VRDKGFNAFANIAPARFVVVSAGYTRSIGYALNTMSFSVGFNLTQMLKPGQPH